MNESIGGVEALNYTAPRKLDQFDAIFWHTDAPFDAFAEAIERPGALPVLSSRGSQRLLACARAWRAEVGAALAAGKAVCLFVGPERPLAYHTFEDVMAFDRLDPLADICRLQTEPASGPIRTVSGEPFASALAPAMELKDGHTGLSGDVGVPLAKAGQSVVASYSYIAPGRVLLLPAAAACAPLASKAFAALGALMENLMHGGDWIDFEPWGRDHRLPGEGALADELDAARAELTRAADAVRVLEERAATLRRRRALMSATGRSLARALEQAFVELGVLVLGHTCGPDVLVLEDEDGFRLNLIIDDPAAEPRATQERFHQANARFEAEFMTTARPTLIDARGNRLGPAATNGAINPRLAIDGGDVVTPADILDRLPPIASAIR